MVKTLKEEFDTLLEDTGICPEHLDFMERMFMAGAGAYALILESIRHDVKTADQRIEAHRKLLTEVRDFGRKEAERMKNEVNP